MPSKIKVPLLDLQSEYQLVQKEIDVALKSCFKQQHWILGDVVSLFEQAVCDYLGVKYAIGVNSGTDALILALRAIALVYKHKPYFDPNDEIITTPFSFIATAEAIVRAGAKPVFVDIDPNTCNLDPAQIKKAINKKTVGILPVHLFGLAAAMPEIMRLAKTKGLFVVEDAAQSLGARIKNKKVGSFGLASAYSFFPSKTLGGYGDAGLITTDDQQLAQKIRELRNHGQTKTYYAENIGYNSRLDSLQAAVLLVKLKYLDKQNNLRYKIACSYNRGLAKLNAFKLLSTPKDYTHVYGLYNVLVKHKRDQLKDHLNRQGIESRVYYPYLLSEMPAFAEAKVCGGLDNAKTVRYQILSLPLHPYLTIRQVNYVIKQARLFFAES